MMTAGKVTAWPALLVGAAVLAWSGSRLHAQETRPEEGDLKCFFGVMHAHSVLSPDFVPQPPNRNAFVSLVGSQSQDRFSIPNGPVAAWTTAADQAKLDFLALTEHVHGPEQDQPEFCEHEMPKGGYELLLEAAKLINTSPLRAIPGMEWSSISSGGS